MDEEQRQAKRVLTQLGIIKKNQMTIILLQWHKQTFILCTQMVLVMIGFQYILKDLFNRKKYIYKLQES